MVFGSVTVCVDANVKEVEYGEDMKEGTCGSLAAVPL